MLKKVALLLAVLSAFAFACTDVYKVDVESAEHGGVELGGIFTSGGESTCPGEAIVVALKPDSGYVAKSLSIVGEDDAEIAYSKNESGLYEFTMPSNAVTIKASFEIGTYKISVEGCEHLSCVAPASAKFGENVSLKVSKGDYELTYKLMYAGVGSVSQSASGDTAVYSFSMPGNDVKFIFEEGEATLKPTEFKVVMNGCETIKCTAPEKAKPGESVTVQVELVEGIAGIGFDIKGIASVDESEMESGKGWVYVFTMPANDVEFVFTEVKVTTSSSSAGSSSSAISSSSFVNSSAASSSSKGMSSSSKKGSSDKDSGSSSVGSSAGSSAASSGSSAKKDVFAISVEGCGGLACEAPESAKAGETVEVRITITEGYSGFDIGVKGVGAVDQENDDKVTYLRFVMPKNDVVFSVTPTEKSEGASSSSGKGDSGSSSSALKAGEYAVSVEGCGELKCKAPASAKKGDSVEVKVTLVSGYTGFDLSVTGIGEMGQENSGKDYFIRFKMPANDVVLTVTPKAKEGYKENQGDAIAGEIRGNAFSVTTLAREIRIGGAPVGAKVRVFDMQGGVVAAGVVNALDFGVVVPHAGVYMIHVGSKILKVNVK